MPCTLPLPLIVRDKVHMVKASLRVETLLAQGLASQNSPMSLNLREGTDMIQASLGLGVHFFV